MSPQDNLPIGNTLQTVSTVIQLFNVVAPEIAKLLTLIYNSDPSRPVGEILAEAGNQWDANIKQAMEALLR